MRINRDRRGRIRAGEVERRNVRAPSSKKRGSEGAARRLRDKRKRKRGRGKEWRRASPTPSPCLRAARDSNHACLPPSPSLLRRPYFSSSRRRAPGSATSLRLSSFGHVSLLRRPPSSSLPRLPPLSLRPAPRRGNCYFHFLFSPTLANEPIESGTASSYRRLSLPPSPPPTRFNPHVLSSSTR